MLKYGVCTSIRPAVVSLCSITATLHGIILLTPPNYSCRCVYSLSPCLVEVFSSAGKRRGRSVLSPDSIRPNVPCVDSIWTRPLTLPLVPESLLPSILLGTRWPVNFASTLRPGYRPCTLTSQEKRTLDGRLPLITSHAPGGWCWRSIVEKLTPDSNLKVSAVALRDDFRCSTSSYNTGLTSVKRQNPKLPNLINWYWVTWVNMCLFSGRSIKGINTNQRGL